jgi:hypothetical protein
VIAATTAAAVLAIAPTTRAGEIESAGATVAYALDDEAQYVWGCFPPCECPLLAAPLTGAFTLTLELDAGVYRTYSLRDVDWTVGDPEAIHHVTGSGVYTIFEEFAVTHRLEMDLSTDGGPVEHFDSGVVVGGNEFPRIDIVASMNQMFCYDTVFEVSAAPASTCPEDLDASGFVGFADVLAVLAAWGPCGAACPEDLDHDDAVGFGDLLAVLSAWGPCPP